MDEQHSQGLAATLARLAERTKTAFADLRERQALRNDFAMWEASGELDSALDAMGLARGQIPAFIAGYPEALRLLPAMAAQVGVDLAAVERPWLPQDMQRVCALCSAHGQCRRWLETAGDGDDYHAFCRNAPTFDELRERG
jgi:Family of unknown function (DUF6455)